jgi:hypothetical protein
MLKQVVYIVTTVIHGKSELSSSVNTGCTLSSEVFGVRDRGKQ